MKSAMRNSLTTLLGATMGVYLMVAPLTTTVYAADNAVHNPPAVTKDIDKDQHHDKDFSHDKDRVQDKGQHRDPGRDHNKDQHHDMWGNYGPRENQERFFQREAALARRMEMYREYLRQNQMNNISKSPVEVVMEAANVLGFDVNTDTFTLISQNDTQAVVQVVHGDINYILTLVPSSDGSWQVSSMNQEQ